MIVTWREPKRRANLVKHGMDFADFETAFDFDRFAAFPTKPSRSGCERFLLVGRWDSALVVAVIVSPLGSEAVDLVSLRPASDKERAAYDRL